MFLIILFFKLGAVTQCHFSCFFLIFLSFEVFFIEFPAKKVNKAGPSETMRMAMRNSANFY